MKVTEKNVHAVCTALSTYVQQTLGEGFAEQLHELLIALGPAADVPRPRRRRFVWDGKPPSICEVCENYPCNLNRNGRCADCAGKRIH